MPNVGPMELILLLIVLLLVFGPKRLPEMGRSVGRGIREFKDSVSGNDDPPEEKPAVPAPPPAPEAAPEQPAPVAAAEPADPKSDTERVAS